MIPELLEERAVDAFTRLVLTNAVYFLGQWSEPFDENATRPRPFTLANGENIDFRAMSDRKSRSWYGAINADGTWFDTPRRVRADRGAPGATTR